LDLRFWIEKRLFYKEFRVPICRFGRRFGRQNWDRPASRFGDEEMGSAFIASLSVTATQFPWLPAAAGLMGVCSIPDHALMKMTRGAESDRPLRNNRFKFACKVP
jgi:hypothetical protein